MKIIALLPFKNEEWALPSFLSSVTRVADEIIALDDSSTDSSAGILNNAGVNIITHDFGNEKVVNMSARRQILLDAGRAAGGTHFVWLDADETFSGNFVQNARKIIEQLKPGQKMTMRWVHPWKGADSYLDDKKSPFGYIWKDFIVCDDGTSNFKDQFLSEARTPSEWKEVLVLPESEGVVLHWQFVDWNTLQLKQALYRCTELIEGSRTARRINRTYSITLDQPNLEQTPIPEIWLSDIEVPQKSNKKDFYYQKVLLFFQSYGITFFEPLQIWHVPELHELFLKKIGREPKVKVFPNWLVSLNTLIKKVW